MVDTFMVRNDNTIDVKSGLTDAGIRDLYESLSARVVFRIVGKTVEYAEVLPRIKGVIWTKAHRV